MDEPTETTTEEKRSRGLGSFVVWAGMIVLLYFLSWGPCLLARRCARLSHPNVVRYVHIIYAPIDLAYANTPLRTPLERYLRLWYPLFYDKTGENVFH
jgi:hypothetical protein